MSTNIKIALGLLAGLLLLGWLASVQFEPLQKDQYELPIKGKTAPLFVLKDITGREVSLSSFKGKMVYVKFWASWCKDCIKQVVPQRTLASSVDTSKVAFIDISIDKDHASWVKAVERFKLSSVELWSANGEDQNLGENYDIGEIPRYILIDTNGIVVDNNAPTPSDISPGYFAQYY